MSDTADIEIREAAWAEHRMLGELRRRLWPDSEAAELITGMRIGVAGMLVAFDEGSPIGWAELSLRRRTDSYADEPMVFLEGWWVDPSHRGRGVGRALIDRAEAWGRARYAQVMGSDAELTNSAGREAHRAVGFISFDEVEVFIRPFSAKHENDPGPARGATVALIPVSRENVRAICALETTIAQRSFVAPNSFSIAEGSMNENAWMRAVMADDTLVGFAMLEIDASQEPSHYLWRFMIDQRFQGRGFGGAALDLIIEFVRSQPGGSALTLSHVPVAGGPWPLYESRGFVETGKVEHGENEAILDLTSTPTVHEDDSRSS